MQKVVILNALKTSRKRLEQSKEVKEYLEVVAGIEELENSIPAIKYFKTEEQKPKIRKSGSTRRYKRRGLPSPVNARHGDKTRTVYDSTVKIIKDAGGEATIKHIEYVLSRDYNITMDHKASNRYVANYIKNFNKLYPNQARLELVAFRDYLNVPGHEKYESIRLV